MTARNLAAVIASDLFTNIGDGHGWAEDVVRSDRGGDESLRRHRAGSHTCPTSTPSQNTSASASVGQRSSAVDATREIEASGPHARIIQTSYATIARVVATITARVNHCAEEVVIVGRKALYKSIREPPPAGWVPVRGKEIIVPSFTKGLRTVYSAVVEKVLADVIQFRIAQFQNKRQLLIDGDTTASVPGGNLRLHRVGGATPASSGTLASTQTPPRPA